MKNHVLTFALWVSVNLSSSCWMYAETVTLNVQPSQSTLNLGGSAFLLPYSPQVAGSLATTWSGTITADINGGVFTFTGGSSITADIHPLGPFNTSPNPAGIVPANYGVTGTGPVFPVGNAVVRGVYRNLVFDIVAGSAQGGAVMSGGSFRLISGELVWGAVTDSGDFSGLSNLANVTGPNTSTSNVTWDGTTLTIPVAVQTDGSNRVEVWTGTIVATLAPQTPSLVNARAYHVGYTGSGSSVNESVELIQRSASDQLVELNNLINSSRGINGVVIDLDNLQTLDDISLSYRMSPQGPFIEASHPVSAWKDAPAPDSVLLQAGQGQEGSDRIAIVWPDNVIANRYLCIRAEVGGTPIFELYLGHLLGETSGAGNNSFSCTFADITPIRSAVGQSVNSSDLHDIDKSGTVSFGDISAMRSNVGAQLTQITIPAYP